MQKGGDRLMPEVEVAPWSRCAGAKGRLAACRTLMTGIIDPFDGALLVSAE
jgi:hypothetical protein